VGTQACFHPNDTSREFLKYQLNLMTFNLLPQDPLSIGIEPNMVENVFAGTGGSNTRID
jgi:hypothetical protein